MTDVPIDPVSQALPCMCSFISAGIDRKRPPSGHAHWVSCPAEYRPAVNALLADRDKRIAELEKALENMIKRFECCCVAMGSDPDMAREATKDARAALEKQP